MVSREQDPEPRGDRGTMRGGRRDAAAGVPRLRAGGPAAGDRRPGAPHPRGARDVRRAVPAVVRRARGAQRRRGDRGGGGVVRHALDADTTREALAACAGPDGWRSSDAIPRSCSTARTTPPARRRSPRRCAKRSSGTGCTWCSSISANKDIAGIVAAARPARRYRVRGKNAERPERPRPSAIAEEFAGRGEPCCVFDSVAEALEAAARRAADETTSSW